MDFTKLGTLNSQQQAKEEAKEEVAQSQTKQQIANIETQEVFVKSIQMLAEFLKGHTSRTVVMNQIKDFATSEDISRATQTLDQLHETLKTHENTDVSPVVDVLNKAVSQLEQIPKEQLDLPEYPEQKDYSEQLDKFITVSESIVEAIQAQETVVESPKVKVEAPNVQVDAPDLKPLSKELDKALSVSFNKAVSKINIPKPADIKPLVTEQKKTTKAIDKLYRLMHDNPFGGSGGGGGASIGSFMSDGALPTTETPYAVIIDDTTTADTTYICKAPIGTATSSASWQISRLTTSSGIIKTWADSNALFDNIADDRASLTYS